MKRRLASKVLSAWWGWYIPRSHENPDPSGAPHRNRTVVLAQRRWNRVEATYLRNKWYRNE